MIYDRPYMQDEYDRRQLAPLAWVLGATIVAFIVQTILTEWLKRPDWVQDYAVLSLEAMRSGYAWTLLTYGFVHTSLLHLIVNLLGIFFLGREVLVATGPRRFVGLYLGSIVVGGILCSIIAAAVGRLPGIAIGSSGAVLALLAFFACLNPDRPITFLLFFVVPVTIKPKYLALIALSLTAFAFLFFELPGNVGVTIPPSALLGGMLTGWGYFRLLQGRPASLSAPRPGIELPAWLRRRKGGKAQQAFRVNLSRSQDIRAEVDRILDKINSQGFGALTDEERRLLDEARDVLNKR